MSFQIGTIVGSYEIVEKIGRGGMATVYKGRHTRLKRDVAIKVLHPMLNDDDSFLRRFDREAQLVAQLEHPHIVPVYDFAEHDHQPYLVMRLVEGDTLKERMMQGTQSREEILRIAQSVADGLDYAHGQGVLHRDIKPSNIMLTSASGVYIADFGLARMAQAGESTLSQDMIMGTPQYISPEQAMGNKELDGRTDLYSFGIILYELVTGQAPFQSETTYSIIHMQIFDAPPLPSSVNPNISPEMESVLLNALAKEPDGRYDTGRELVSAFRTAFEAMPEDFAPGESATLPDYTPVGVTRVQPDAKEAPDPEPVTLDATPVEAAIPPLPELVIEETTSDSVVTAENVEKTAVVPPPSKKPIPTWAIIAGTTVVVLLIAALAFGMFELGEQRGEDELAGPPNQQTNPGPDQPIDNPPLADQEPNSPQNAGQPGRLVIVPPPRNLRPIEDLENALAEDPEDQQLKAELALAYMQNSNPEDAEALVSEIFSKIRQPHQFILTIDQLLETENYALASLVAQEGLTRAQENPELQHRLLMALILSNTPPEIIEEFADSFSDYPSPPSEINLDIAEAYLSFSYGDIDEALDILEDLTQEDENPFLASTYFLLGRLHMETGNPEAAREALDQAIAYEPFPWLMLQIENRLNP